MSKLLALSVAALTLAFPAAATKSVGTCAVQPNTVTTGETFTVTASANVPFDFHLVSPAGVIYVWPVSGPGTVNYQWAVDQPGAWTVTVNSINNAGHKRVIGECGLTVLAPPVSSGSGENTRQTGGANDNLPDS